MFLMRYFSLSTEFLKKQSNQVCPFHLHECYVGKREVPIVSSVWNGTSKKMSEMGGGARWGFLRSEIWAKSEGSKVKIYISDGSKEKDA